MHGEHRGTDTNTVPRDRSSTTVPRDRLLMAVLAAVLMLLSACTGDPSNVTTPTVGSTTTTTPTTQTTPEPIRPVEEATPESAIQFTRYFWDLYNYAYQTYDTAPLKAISDPACSFCEGLVRDIAKTSNARTRISGYRLTLVEATSPPVKISSGTLVIGTLSQKSGRATGPDGAYTRLPGFKSVKSTVALKWIEDSWRIEGITNDPKTRKAWGA